MSYSLIVTVNLLQILIANLLGEKMINFILFMTMMSYNYYYDYL